MNRSSHVDLVTLSQYGGPNIQKLKISLTLQIMHFFSGSVGLKFGTPAFWGR